MIWFTADLHLGHKNICRFCNRPQMRPGDLDSQGQWVNEGTAILRTNEMDDMLIKNWNDRVSKKDEVYVIGDFAWTRHLHYMMALNGKKHLILGNHDKANLDVYKNFTSVQQILQKAIDGKMVVMCHFPMLSWNARIHGSWHVYGHVHGRLRHCRLENTLDVGTDCWDYAPVHWDVAKEKIMEPSPLPLFDSLRESTKVVVHRDNIEI